MAVGVTSGRCTAFLRDGDRIEAEAVVCALPVGPLRDVMVSGVSEARLESLHRQRSALAAKTVVAYPSSFWDVSGATCDGIWSSVWIQREGVLSSLTPPDRLGSFLATPEPQRRREFLDMLAGLMGDEAREPILYGTRAWGMDPFTQGYVTAWRPGDVMAVGPLHGTHEPPFYVCGSDQWVAGYMEGAVRSGRDAASQALGRGTARLPGAAAFGEGPGAIEELGRRHGARVGGEAAGGHRREGLLDREALAAAGDLLRRLDGERGAAGDVAGEPARLVHELRCRYHRADEAAPLRLGRAEAPARQEQVHGKEPGEPARQPLSAARVRDDAEAQLGQEQLGMVGRDDQVAGEHQLEAAAGGQPVDGRDHRFVEVEHLGQAGEAARAEVGRGVLLAGGRRLEVPAGREEALTGAGQDRHAQVVVVTQPREGIVELDARRAVDRVRLRPVEHDLEDAAAHLGPDGGHRQRTRKLVSASTL